MSLELLQWLEAKQKDPRVRAHFAKVILIRQKEARSTSSSMPIEWPRISSSWPDPARSGNININGAPLG